MGLGTGPRKTLFNKFQKKMLDYRGGEGGSGGFEKDFSYACWCGPQALFSMIQRAGKEYQ